MIETSKGSESVKHEKVFQLSTVYGLLKYKMIYYTSNYNKLTSLQEN